MLQAAAIAYSRGAGLPDARPLSRYQDPLLLGVAAQAFAVLWLAERTLRPGRMVAVAWLATLCIGFISLTEINLTQNLPYKRAHDTASLANIRDYAETGDAAILERNFGLPQPPEDSAVMRSVLDDPSIRRILPAGLTVSKVACIDRPPRIVLLGPWLSLVGGVTLVVSTILLVLKFRPVSSD